MRCLAPESVTKMTRRGRGERVCIWAQGGGEGGRGGAACRLLRAREGGGRGKTVRGV